MDPKSPILVFGEILADVFPDRTVLGGAPFNVARHLAAFGLAPTMVSRIGNDDLGADILRTMSSNGMRTEGVQIDPVLPTGRVLVRMEGSSHHFEILPMQAYDCIDPDEAGRIARTDNPPLLYFGSLGQRHEISRRALKTIVQNVHAYRLLDINLRQPWYTPETLHFSMHNANFVKLNTDELHVLASLGDIGPCSPHEQARHLIQTFGLERVVVTCAQAGAWHMDASGTLHQAADTGRPVHVVDTVGAGDAFTAVCILGICKSWPTGLTLDRANAFAAAICGIRGAVPDSADFYTPFFKEWTL
jgi:fructokinase